MSKADTRKPRPQKVVKPPTAGRDQLRVYLLHHGKKAVRIDHLVTGFSWTEPRDTAITSGSMTTIAPAGRENRIRVVSGDRILVTWSPHPGGRFTPLWIMRVREPSYDISAYGGSLNLSSDLALAQESQDAFKYVKSKSKPKGWRTDEIAADVCRRFGIPHAPFPRGKHYVKKKVYDQPTDPLTVFNDAWLAERTNTGRRFVLAWRLNKLTVTPLRRSRTLLALGPTLIEAALSESFKELRATAVTVRGTTQAHKGKDAKGRRKVEHHKIALTVKSKSAISRFGFIHRIVYALDAESVAEARQLAQRYIAKMVKPLREVTLTLPGIPTIKRGDSIRLSLPNGLRQNVWVAEATHTVAPGNYTMEVTVIFDDPFKDEKADRIVDAVNYVATTKGRGGAGTSTKTKKKASNTGRNATRKIAPAPTKTLGEQLSERAAR